MCIVHVFQWGAGWFEPVRDGGVGWNFAKDAKPAIDERVHILLAWFYKERRILLLALHDVILNLEKG